MIDNSGWVGIFIQNSSYLITEFFVYNQNSSYYELFFKNQFFAKNELKNKII